MTHLTNALRNLQVHLPANWIDPFAATLIAVDDGSNQKILDAKIFVLTLLDSTARAFFDETHYSVITGEYVEDLTVAGQLLDQIEQFLTGFAANIDLQGYPNITLAIQQVFTDAFLQAVRASLKKYRMLIDFVSRHINYKPGSSLIFHELANEGATGDLMSSTANTAAGLFEINLDLAKIDNAISLRRETIKDLLLLQYQLTQLNSNAGVPAILLLKCGFLLYKLSFRLQQSKTKYDYAIEFQYASVNHVPITEFTKLNEVIDGHYDSGINPSSFDTRSKEAQDEFRKQIPMLDLDQYHALTKYFKDEEKNVAKLERLKLLYEQFHRDKLNQVISDFDKKAYEIAFCYIENNLLSLELDNKLFNLENWETKFKDYTDRAELSNSSNFFPYFKIIDKFLIPEINEQFKKTTENFEVIDRLIKSFSENLNKLLKNAAICEETNYLPYQADYQHSFVTLTSVQIGSQQCFISSSFALPLDFNMYKEKWEEYKVELTKFKTMLDNQRLLRKDRKIIQEVKADMSRTDKRHIEILSIFAALVMFVSNEIQIFTKIPNMADAVAYTLFFAYGLGLFVLLIWFITRAEGLKKESLSTMHYWIPGLFLLGLVSGVIYIAVKQPQETVNQIKLDGLNFKIDSLKKQLIIDSLKLEKKRPNKEAHLKNDSKQGKVADSI